MMNELPNYKNYDILYALCNNIFLSLRIWILDDQLSANYLLKP